MTTSDSQPHNQPQSFSAMDNKKVTNGKLKRTSGLTQAYELRELAYNLAKKIGTGNADESEKKAARDVTGLIRAWAEADDSVRIHRGKPLPGSLKPVRTKPNRRKTETPVPTPSPKPAVGTPQ